MKQRIQAMCFQTIAAMAERQKSEPWGLLKLLLKLISINLSAETAQANELMYQDACET